MTAVSITPRTIDRDESRWPVSYIRRHLSLDDKTATIYRAAADRAHDGAPNATWWSAYDSCPGATAICAGALVTGGSEPVACYAYKQEQRGDRHNLRHAAAWRLREWNRLGVIEGGQLALEVLIYSWRRQLALGVEVPTFRLLASGDLDLHRARQWRLAWDALADLEGPALVDALQVDPEPAHHLHYRTRHLRSWLYTRSYGTCASDAARALVDDSGKPPPGVVLYLSVDESCRRRAATALATWAHRLPLAALSTRPSTGRRLIQGIREAANLEHRPLFACPVDAGSSRYDGPRHRDQATGKTVGACTHCGRCWLGPDVPDIVFVSR